jgi:integrase
MEDGRSELRARYVVDALERFCSDQGLSPGDPLRADVIEALCAIGMAERKSSTRGTYRSVLRNLSRESPPIEANGYPGSRALAPYSRAERAELRSVARLQRALWRRESALSFLALGIGAGLRAGEIAAARGSDVVVRSKGVFLRVGGPSERTVCVSGPYSELLVSRTRGTTDEFLFHPKDADRSYPNFINDFCRNLVADPASPKLNSSRCRSSFICDHLSKNTPLRVVLELSGIAEVESLLRYARYVSAAPQSKAQLREQLRREQVRR